MRWWGDSKLLPDITETNLQRFSNCTDYDGFQQ